MLVTIAGQCAKRERVRGVVPGEGDVAIGLPPIGTGDAQSAPHRTPSRPQHFYINERWRQQCHRPVNPTPSKLRSRLKLCIFWSRSGADLTSWRGSVWSPLTLTTWSHWARNSASNSTPVHCMRPSGMISSCGWQLANKCFKKANRYAGPLPQDRARSPLRCRGELHAGQMWQQCREHGARLQLGQMQSKAARHAKSER